MENKLFKKLISENEGTLLDFKSEFYNINDKESRISFAKDVICFANTTISNDGYIICGIGEETDKTKKFVGIDRRLYIDDAQWRQVVNKYASHPVDFDIIHFEYENKLYIIIKIKKEQYRPIICRQSEGTKLVQGHIYYRNGSSNDIAKDLVTIEKIIAKDLLKGTDKSIDPTYNKFNKFPPAPYYSFIGRNDELEKIKKELIYHHKNYICSLVGEGGVGKTSIAYKLAYEVKEKIENGDIDLDDVIWISAKDQRIYLDTRREIEREFKSIDNLYDKILGVFYDPVYISNLSKENKIESVNQAMMSSKFLFEHS